MDFAQAKALLQKTGNNGASVYDHLSDMILKILSEQPTAGVADIEAISASVQAAASPTQPRTDELDAAVQGRIRALAALFKAPGAEEGEEEPPPAEPVQNLTEEAHYLEWAGFSLGRTETFRLQLALGHLAAKEPVRGLRLWGKLLGTQRDYLVAEGSMDVDPDEEAAAAAADENGERRDALGNVIETHGTGANRHMYWVCSSVGTPRTRLPAVTPHAIAVARNIRRFLTGDLTAPVRAHPPFPGGEALYARALIALISAGTAISPAGVFAAVDGDETGAVEPNPEEFEAPDLTQPESWVHHQLDLNRLGRTRPNPPRIGDDGEEIPDPDAPEPSAPLKPITDDLPVDEADEEGGSAWEIRPVPVSGMVEGAPPAAVVVRSRRWPGAVTVGFGGVSKRYAGVYIGYGHELPPGGGAEPFNPALPGPLPREYDLLGVESEASAILEKADVTVDPDEGKEAEEGDEEQED